MRIIYGHSYASEIPVNKPTYVIQYFHGDTIESVLVEDCPNVVYAIIQARDDPAHRDYTISLACDETIPIYTHRKDGNPPLQTYEIQLWEPDKFSHNNNSTENPFPLIVYIITQWLATECYCVLDAIAWARDNPCEIYQVYLTIAGTPWLLYGKFPDKIPDEEYIVAADSSRIYAFFESELEEYLEP